MIRLALLGCGDHSRSSHAAPLARYAAQNPGVIELVAACDLNFDRAREFCRDFGFARAYSDVETMLATERVDGCVCVMPMERIVELAVMLLERKIPCVIEKPLGMSTQEAERLALVTRETGTLHMVSVNRRFMPYLNQAKSWAKNIGPLQYVRATQIRDARDEPDFIWSTAIHVLDALRREHEVPLQKVRKALLYVSQHLHSHHPLAEQRFETDGVDLFIQQNQDQRQWQRCRLG
jgi:predicted dehydrogenase